MTAEELLSQIQQAPPSELKKHAEAFLAQYPERVEGYLVLGKAHLADKNSSEAAYYFYKAQDKAAENTEVLASLALLNLESGEVDAARYYYDAILNIAPDSVVAHIGKGDCAFAFEEYDTAAKHYTKALALGAKNKLESGEYAIVVYKCAKAYLELKQLQEALLFLDNAAPDEFNEAITLIKRSILGAIGSEKTAAIIACTELLHAQSPLNSKYILELTELIKTQGTPDRIEELYSKLLELDIDKSTRTEALYGRAHLRMELENYAGALEDYNQLIALDEQWYYYQDRAFVKEQLRDLKSALNDITKALSMQSSPDADSLLYRGKLFMKAGALDLAISDFTRLLKMDAANADACYELGLAHNKKGENDKAFKALVDAEINGHAKASALLVAKFAKQVAALRKSSAIGFLKEFEPLFDRNTQSPILARAFAKLWVPDMNRLILAVGDDMLKYPAALIKRILADIEQDLFLISPQGLLFFEGDRDPIEAYYKIELESSHALVLQLQPVKGGERSTMRLLFHEDSLLINYPLQEGKEAPAKYFLQANTPTQAQKQRLQTRKFDAPYLDSLEETIKSINN